MLFDLLLVMLGFGFIVFVHELGHFVAARWAGIRVLAFAIGFGPPLLTYRKGLGVRRGSTEREYFERFRQHHQQLADRSAGDLLTKDQAPCPSLGLSPTEYRLNALPFGGYVKMLGQDDTDPTATSDAADSYQRCAPWKRMVVISAGVVMNLLIAALLFIVVMMAGRMVEPARIGGVAAGSPASQAVALDEATRAAFSSTGAGLQPGDRILTLDGDPVRTFDDVFIGTAMSRAGQPIELTVERPGLDAQLRMQVTPAKTMLGPFLEMGISHPIGSTIMAPKSADLTTQVREILDSHGLTHIEPGAKLVEVRTPAGPSTLPSTGSTLAREVERSNGSPITAVFVNPDQQRREVVVTPTIKLQGGLVRVPSTSTRGTPAITDVEHVLGFTGVMRVQHANEPAQKQGLRSGDIFARIGTIEYPAFHEGMPMIRAAKGRTVAVTVLRPREDGSGFDEVELPNVAVRSSGTIGFTAGTTTNLNAILAAPIPEVLRPTGASERQAAARLSLPAGTRILSVDGISVTSLLDVRHALRTASLRHEGRGWDAELVVVRPMQGTPGETKHAEQVLWTLTQDDARLLQEQAWTANLPLHLFEQEQTLLKAQNPIEALSLGLWETKRVMLSTYLTFVRLAQGSVAFDQLKGPVGIAHIGTIVSGRGFIWLLFFLAMISVNLAVVNFLPLPIVDGGQFLFLVYEAIRGKPVPVGVQNVVTMAGLVMIGSVFLLVTYNDIRNLLGV